MLGNQIARAIGTLKSTGILSNLTVDYQSQSASVQLLTSTSSADENGFNRTTVATHMMPERGYLIRTEQVYQDGDEDNEFEMKTAFTMNEEYIGDPEWAERLYNMGIVPQLASPKHKVCSVGYCEKEDKWYGWSHRAISGFGVGSEVTRGHCAYKPSTKAEFLQSLDDWYRHNGNEVNVIPTDDGAIVNTTSFRVTDGKPLRYTHIEEFKPGRGSFKVCDMDEAKTLALDFAESVSAAAVNVDSAIVQDSVLSELSKRFQEMSARMLTKANQLLRIQRFLNVNTDGDLDGPGCADKFHTNLKSTIEALNGPNDSDANFGLTTRKASLVNIPSGDNQPDVGTPPKPVEEVGPVVGEKDDDEDYTDRLDRLKARHGSTNYIESEIQQRTIEMFSGAESPVSLSMESEESEEILAECEHSRIIRNVIHFDEYAPASGLPFVKNKENGNTSSILDANLSDYKVMDERCASIIQEARLKIISNREAYKARTEKQKSEDDNWSKVINKMLTGSELNEGPVRSSRTSGVDSGMASEAAAKFAPTEFSWFKYIGKKTRSFDHHKQDVELEIETNERFGIMYNSRLKAYIIVEASMFGARGEVWEFRINEKELKLLVKSSRPFNGKIGGQKIVKGEPTNLNLFTNRKQVEVKPLQDTGMVAPNRRVKKTGGVKIIKRLDMDDVEDGVKIKRKPVYIGVFQPSGSSDKYNLVTNEKLSELKTDLQSRMEALPDIGSFATIYQLRSDNRFVIKALKAKVPKIQPAHKSILDRESLIKPVEFKGKNIRLRNDSVPLPHFQPGAPEFTEPMFFGNQTNVLAEIRDSIVLDKYFSGAFTLLDPKGYMQKKSYKRSLNQGKASERRSKMGIRDLKSKGMVFLELVALHDSNSFEDEAYALLIRLRKQFGKKIIGQVEVKRLKLDGINKEYLTVRLIANIKPVSDEIKKRSLKLYDLIESNKLSIGINQYGFMVGDKLIPCAVIEPVYTEGSIKVQPTNAQLRPEVVSDLYDLNGTVKLF